MLGPYLTLFTCLFFHSFPLQSTGYVLLHVFGALLIKNPTF